MLEIYFRKDDKELQVPYVFPNQQLEFPQENSNFETLSGQILTLIGSSGLKGFVLKSFFPHKEYSWLPKGVTLVDECLEFFKQKGIFEVIVFRGDIEEINMLCTITDFVSDDKTNGDVNYSMKITEYIDPNEVK